LGREITEQEWKTHQTVKHSAHSVTVYILFTTVLFYLHINCIHVPNGPVGTDECLRLSLGRLGRHKFVQKQVELQTHKQLKFSNKPQSFAAKLFRSGNAKEMFPDGHCGRSC
jgi:hypothetical protein